MRDFTAKRQWGTSPQSGNGGNVDVSFFNVANNLHGMAMEALDRDAILEGYRYLEMALTSSMMVRARRPLSVRLLPKAHMSLPVVWPTHVVVTLSGGAITVEMRADFIEEPAFTYERLAIIGDVFSRVIEGLPEGEAFRCVLDVGDGYDAGDYRRAAFCSARANTVLIPDPYFYMNDGYEPYRQDIAEKAQSWTLRRNQVFWRGGAGGEILSAANPNDPMDWRCRQRLHLCAKVLQSTYPDFLDVGLSHTRTIEELFLVQALKQSGVVKGVVDKAEFHHYRYQIDVDGWTNAWSFFDKLISGSTVLKIESASGNRQWFYGALQPWTHFVPIAADLSDFDDILQWVQSHPAESEAIAAAGSAATERFGFEASLEQAANNIRGLLQPLS